MIQNVFVTYAAVAVNISIGRAVVKTASISENRKENPAIAHSRYGSLSMKYKPRTAIEGMRDERETLTVLLMPVRRLSLMREIPVSPAPVIGV